MRKIAGTAIILGALGLVLGIVARVFSGGTIAGQGSRVFATGSGLCLLLAVALLLFEKK